MWLESSHWRKEPEALCRNSENTVKTSKVLPSQVIAEVCLKISDLGRAEFCVGRITWCFLFHVQPPKCGVYFEIHGLSIFIWRGFLGSFVNVFPFIKVLYPRKFLVMEQLTKNISYKIMLL